SEKINKYNKEIQETERLKTKYLIYSADERNNKYLSRQFYDNMDELMKEDTLIYDKNNNLLSRCLNSSVIILR
ncbi:MAG: hypothetical protein EBU93_05680, partial [Chlamydiae bacterium]|nr:hypothetical protein [Chlamydiota bacterium]